jgi:hypothetical protein
LAVKRLGSFEANFGNALQQVLDTVGADCDQHIGVDPIRCHLLQAREQLKKVRTLLRVFRREQLLALVDGDQWRRRACIRRCGTL